MSRRPISNQGRAKPDVKSYPTRPHTTTKQKKPVDPLKAEEEEYKRMNEELEREFPEISKQYGSFVDPTNPTSLEGFLKQMGSQFGADMSSFPDTQESINTLIPEDKPGESFVPSIDKLMESFNCPTELSDQFSSIKAREKEYNRLNDELNEKNATMMEDCRALLTKLNSGEEIALENEIEAPPLTEDFSANFESIKAREKEYKRLSQELDKKNAIVTKQAEEILNKQRRKDPLLNSKLSSKKPPQTRSINTKPVKSTEKVVKPHTQDTIGIRTDSEESIEALRDEILSGTDFSDAIRRIEAKVLKINSTEQAELLKEQTIDSQVEIEATHRQISEKQKLNLGRPATAPGPVPRTAGASRAKDPIRDIEPPEEVGAEAIQRFLKAKLNVLQEELDRASEEIAQKDAELQECKKELLAKQEQNIQLDRQATSLRTVSEKQQKKLDLVTNELDNSKLEIAGLKRDLDSQVRNQKKTDSTQSAVEVRLNRALEEIEKHKYTIQQLKSDTKDTQHSSGKKLEELQSENKILFKQREELMTGFKKQMRLIDNLKRQKMHIEAAKMLAFSEEEFMRVLDWWKVKD